METATSATSQHTVASIGTIANTTNSTAEVSEEERQRYLSYLQSNTTITMIPAMIFLIILGVTGLVGNSLVLFVYSQRFKRTSTRVLILSIAGFDIVSNVVAIPGEIYDMLHIWDFNHPTFCQARMFCSGFTTLSSAMILLAVAVVRYRKVCHPYGWHVSIKQTKIISLVIALLGVLFAIPYVLINGRQTKKTPRPDIFGYECSTDDKYKNTVYPLLNNGFFLLLFVSCCTPLTILYILIGVKACRHRALHRSPKAFEENVLGRTKNESMQSNKSKSNSSLKEDVTPQLSSKPSLITTLSTTSGSKESPPKLSDERTSDKFSRKEKAKKAESNVSSEFSSADFGSVAEEMRMYKEELEAAENKNSCEVSIVGDTVEIRTAILGQFSFKLESVEDSDAVGNDHQSHSGSKAVSSCPDGEKLDKHLGNEEGTCPGNSHLGRRTEPLHGDLSAIETSLLQEQSQGVIKKADTDNTSYEDDPQKKSENGPNSVDQWKESEIANNHICHDVGDSENDTSGGAQTSSNTRRKSSVWNKVKLSLTKGSLLRVVKNRKPLGKTTIMLIIISAVYALAFLPFLALMFFKFLAPTEYASMTMLDLSFYNLFLRSYFLNCAANPVIYSFCDANFRKECFALLKCLYRR